MPQNNTGNPIGEYGSDDPLDLLDNTQNLDFAMTSDEDTWETRLGKLNKTWKGLQKQVTDYLISQGYESVYLAYGAGIVVQRQTQLVQRSGELYRVTNAADIPLTLTGTWATDATKLLSVGDAALRQALAASGGSAMIGDGAQTVAQRLIALDARLDAKDSVGSLKSLLVDMHFGTLCGVGWLGATELGGFTPTPSLTTSAAAKGASTLVVNNTSIFRQNQLICFVGADNTWYSSVVASIAGSTLTLDRPLPIAVSVGAQVVYFYNDYLHANTYGFYCVADSALRQVTLAKEVYYTQNGPDNWTPYAGPEVLTAQGIGTAGIADYKVPGGDLVTTQTLKVVNTATQQGAKSKFVALPAGEYVLNLVLSCNSPVIVAVEELRPDGSLYNVGNEIVTSTAYGLRNVDVDFSVARGASVRVIVISNQAGASTYYVGKFTHSAKIETLESMDRGVHVMLGDSWFAQGPCVARFQQRLPNATVIQAGFSGDNANAMIARFATDVTPYKPNFVWTLCGTNNFRFGDSTADFAYGVGRLRAMTMDIGARPIMFNPAVGDINTNVVATGVPYLRHSREYAIAVEYLQSTYDADWIGAKYASCSIISGAVSIPAGATVVLGTTPGLTRLAAYLDYMFAAASAAGITINVGYSPTTLPTSLEWPVTFAPGTTITGSQIAKGDLGGRHLCISVSNGTGAAITVSLSASVKWINP